MIADQVDIKAVMYTIIAKGASGFMKPGYPAKAKFRHLIGGEPAGVTNERAQEFGLNSRVF